jgi:predicted MPP superfamily phosphohydrolase
MVAALVISDIHLIRPDTRPLDIDIELRNGLIRFLPAVLERFPGLSLILVCGDIAFQAAEKEYAAAASFLREIQARLGGPRVRVIPGNHDIELASTASPDQRLWRARVRQSGLDDDGRDAELQQILADETSGPGLFEALSAYNQFAAAYQCEVSHTQPFWTEHLPLTQEFELQIRGLTSVLISDRHDRADRLMLGSMQVADLEQDSPGIVTLTLCHHPYEWLLDGERQRARLRHRSPLHVTGHEHTHEIRVDEETSTLHLCLGALQPTRNPTWDPRVSAIGVDISDLGAGARARFEIFGARWDRHADRFIADIDEEKFVTVTPREEGAKAPPPPIEAFVARLTERFAALQPSNRLDAARSVGVSLGELASEPPERIPSLVVQSAWQERRLHQLWDEVARLHGNQAGEVNPFGVDE